MPRACAQDVILEILRNTEDGEWTGKTKLFKAFYFAHLYYAKDRPGILTDWPIARMPEGPGIDKSHKILGELIDEGFLTVQVIHQGPYPEYRYRLTDKGRQTQSLSDDARKAIREAALFCLPMTAMALSRFTHEYSRSWKQSTDGAILDIYIDMIPDEEYLDRCDGIDRMDQRLSKIFSEVTEG